MKLLLSALTFIGAMGAAAFVQQQASEPRKALTTAAIESAKNAQQYHLRIPGREGSCKLLKQGPAEAVRAKIELGENCDSLMPRLADVRYWHEKGAGEVTLVADDGRAIVEFFPGDGVAYESFYPKSPIVALTVR